MKTIYSPSRDSAGNGFASWWRSDIDPRFFYVSIYDVFFGTASDGRAVVDDFGNLIALKG